MPKARSLVGSGRMPMISAAMSRSRMAIHERPTRPRTRFLATSAEQHRDAERDHVANRRGRQGPGHHHAEHRARRRGDRARRRVVDEPRDLVEEPDQEELGGQRGHGQVEALDAQAGDAEEQADAGRDQPGQHEHQQDVQAGEARRELERGVGAHRHEAAGAERQLPRVARQQIQAERRQRIDQERDEHRLQPVLAGQQRRQQEGRHQPERDEHPILDDRKDRLIGGVGRLELPGLAVDHTRSMIFSPKRPCGRTSRKPRART